MTNKGAAEHQITAAGVIWFPTWKCVLSIYRTLLLIRGIHCTQALAVGRAQLHTCVVLDVLPLRSR